MSLKTVLFILYKKSCSLLQIDPSNCPSKGMKKYHRVYKGPSNKSTLLRFNLAEARTRVRKFFRELSQQKMELRSAGQPRKGACRCPGTTKEHKRPRNKSTPLRFVSWTSSQGAPSSCLKKYVQIIGITLLWLARQKKIVDRSRDAQSSVQQVQATLFYPAWRLRFSRRFELFEPRGRRCEGKLVRGSPRTKFDCLRPGWPRDRIKRHRNIRRKGRATSPRQWPLSDVLPLSPMLTSQVTHDFQHVTRHANHHRLSLLSVLLASSTHALR